MEINFSNTELIFMYGHFRKQARKLQEIKSAPNCCIDAKNLDTDIALYTSIADKLRETVPSLAKLDNYRI